MNGAVVSRVLGLQRFKSALLMSGRKLAVAMSRAAGRKMVEHG